MCDKLRSPIWLVVKVLDPRRNLYNYELIRKFDSNDGTVKGVIGERVYFNKAGRTYRGTVLFYSPVKCLAKMKKLHLENMRENCHRNTASTSNSNVSNEIERDSNDSCTSVQSDNSDVYEDGDRQERDSNDSCTSVQSDNSDVYEDGDRQNFSHSDQNQHDISCKCKRRFRHSEPTSHEPIPSSSTPRQDRNPEIFRLKFDVTSQTDPVPEPLSADTIDELKNAMLSVIEKFNFFSSRILNIMNKIALDKMSDYNKLTELQEQLARLRERFPEQESTSSVLLDQTETTLRSSEHGTENSQSTSKDSTGY